jgi:hypothetical protein
MGLGITDPESTEYVFVSLNPGGNEVYDIVQDPIKSSQEHPSIQAYLANKFPHARSLRKFISAFAQERASEFDDEVQKFGTTNLSYFYARTSGELGNSFFIEVKECLPLLLEELSLPHLKALIMAGVSRQDFFYALYQPGADIKDARHGGSNHEQMESFKTTLVTGANCLVAFIVHPSATRGLTNASIESLGKRFARLV